MEIIMKEISEKLHNQAMDSFRPLAEYMADKGASENDIVQTFQNQMRIKSGNYYAKEPERFSKILKRNSLIEEKTSKAEWILKEMLIKNEIEFKYQYKIGPYSADFLVKKIVDLEIDGPYHTQPKDDRRDKYIRNMGYKILRIPLWLLFYSPQALIDELKII